MVVQRKFSTRTMKQISDRTWYDTRGTHITNTLLLMGMNIENNLGIWVINKNVRNWRVIHIDTPVCPWKTEMFGECYHIEWL